MVEADAKRGEVEWVLLLSELALGALRRTSQRRVNAMPRSIGIALIILEKRNYGY
jgi:hypothetical protein